MTTGDAMACSYHPPFNQIFEQSETKGAIPIYIDTQDIFKGKLPYIDLMRDTLMNWWKILSWVILWIDKRGYFDVILWINKGYFDK